MRIGSYEVVSEIGRGGAGVVYRARSSDGRDVAVKLLLRIDGEKLARFERERRLHESLGEAEGFVPLLEAGASPAGPFLAMPFVAGGTLRARLEAGPLGVDETVSLGRSLAAALGHAHGRGIVHRDLKPENILLTHRGADSSWGRPLVADLGLAKHFSADTPGASQSVALSLAGGLRGTVGYMPYEQMADASAVGPGADVFALGAILFECLAGQPAFVGESPIELLRAVQDDRRPRLESLRPDAPRWLASLVERCLARDPAARFADAGALSRALQAAQPSRLRRVAGTLVASAVFVGLALAVAGALARSRHGDDPAAGPGAAVTAPLATARPVAPPPPPGAAGRPGPVTRVEVAAPHRAPISALAIVGRVVLTGGEDGSAKLWDAATGTLERTLGLQMGSVRCVDLQPVGAGRLAVVADRKKIVVWDAVADVEVASTTQFRDPIRTTLVDIFGTGGFDAVLVSLEEGYIANWIRIPGAPPVESGMSFRTPSAVAYQVGTTNVCVLLGSRDGSLWLQDLSGVRWSERGKSPITALFWSAGGKALSADRDGVVTVWDIPAVDDPRRLATVRHATAVRTTAATADGRFGLSASDDGRVKVFPLAEGAVATDLGAATGGPIVAASFVDGTDRVVVARGANLECWQVAPGAAPRLVWSH